MNAGKLKILKDGNRITYIYASEKENILLITLADGKIIIEKQCIYSAEVALSLASALKHAVGMMNSALLTEEGWQELERFWVGEYDALWQNTSNSE